MRSRVSHFVDIYLLFSNWTKIRHNRARSQIFLKFPLFYLANEEIQSGKIHNYIYCLNFPTLNLLIRKIKEWEFQKSFYHSLRYFYTYPASSVLISAIDVDWSNFVENTYYYIFDKIGNSNILSPLFEFDGHRIRHMLCQNHSRAANQPFDYSRRWANPYAKSVLKQSIFISLK